MRAFACLFVCFLFSTSAARTAEDLPPLEVHKIADGVWIHTTYLMVTNFGPYPANGLIIEGDNEVIIADSPMTDDDMQDILDWVKVNIDKPVRTLIVHHGHGDSMGAIDMLHDLGVRSVGHIKTTKFGATKGFSPLHTTFDGKEMSLTIDGVDLQLYHPGRGHTGDNIVTYLPQKKVIFGGCLIRAKNTSFIGNTADGFVSEWAPTALAVAKRFPDAEILVPGHGPYGDLSLADHTASIAEKEKARRAKH